MLNLTVPYNYAFAIFNSGFDVNKVYNCFVELSEILHKKPLFSEILNSYYIPNSQKKKMFFDFFGDLGEFNKIFDLIFNNGKCNLLIYIIDIFIKLYRKREGIGEITVVSSVSLTDSAIKKIVETMKSKFKFKDVVCNLKVDPSIISGFLVYVDDKVFDLSLKGFLDKVENKLTKC